MPVQVPELTCQPAGTVSVIVVVVAAAARLFTAPLAGVLAVVVVMLSVPKPLSPLKLNVPIAPTVVLANCKVGTLALVIAQVMTALGTMLAAGTVMT